MECFFCLAEWGGNVAFFKIVGKDYNKDYKRAIGLGDLREEVSNQIQGSKTASIEAKPLSSSSSKTKA